MLCRQCLVIFSQDSLEELWFWWMNFFQMSWVAIEVLFNIRALINSLIFFFFCQQLMWMSGWRVLIHCLQMTWILVSLSSISSLKLFKACHLQVFLKSQIIFKFSFISNLTISEVIKDLEVIFLLLFLVRCT